MDRSATPTLCLVTSKSISISSPSCASFSVLTSHSQTSPGVYGAHPPEDQHNTVVEPVTGLPANVEKYGDGHGGTDGSSTVHGLHQGSGQAGTGQTDWEQIRKADTPY